MRQCTRGKCTEHNAPEDNAPEHNAPEEDALEDNATKYNAPEDKASEDKAPEDKASEDNAPEDNAAEDNAAEDNAPEDNAPEDNAPEDNVPEHKRIIHQRTMHQMTMHLVIPQSITAKYGLAIGATLSPLVYVLIAVTFIVTWPISKVLDCLLGSERGTFYKRSQFKILVDLHGDSESSENGLEEPFTQHEIRIIKNTLDMKVKTTEDIIVSIDDVFMINVDDTLNRDTLKLLQEMAFSRIPIYEGNRDNIVTVLLTKTLLCLDPYQTIPIRALLSSKATRDVIFVQPDLPLFELLYELKGPKGHLAFVREQTRSYSLAPKILGIITLEDLMEELLQEEIVDETDVNVNIYNKLQVANTKRASISLVIENQIRKRIQKTTTTPTTKRNYRSVSVPDIDVAPFYNNRKISSRQSIPCILESTVEDPDETLPLIN
ncbi:CNNM [Mytilus coruscus]|uniref:CNNM n=1 Tax=Mytilus coruscus TaxID=42192 RepID=A0A6J8C7V9_MYTCO|nr:CNNM [Mytilus coruscus]